jgi:hypothetical protein
VPGYLVEAYFPQSRTQDARAAGLRVSTVAEELSREGTPVRHVRTTFVPGDETCFLFFEAASAEAVGELCRRAAIDSPRIVLAVE